MADSFELLRSKIVIEIESVKQAMKAVTDLQKQLKIVENPVKLNVKAPKAASSAAGQANDANKLAESIAKIQVAAAKAELSTSNLTTKIRKLTDLRDEAVGLITPESTIFQQKQVLALERQLKAAQDRIKSRSLANSRIQINADKAVDRALVKSAKDAAKVTEQARLQSIARVQRLAKRLQLGATDVTAPSTKRVDLLNRAEAVLLRLRQRVNAQSKEALKIETQLSAIRKQRYKIQVDASKVSESNEQLKTMLKTLANVSAGIGQLPGINRFIGSIFTATQRFLFAGAQISKLTSSMASLTIGLTAGVAAIAIVGSALLSLASAALRAAVAIGRAGLTLALNVLGRTISIILTPTRAAYQALTQLFSISGMRSFASEALNVAGRMEQIRQQLALGFGAGADEEFRRLSKEADLFGTSLIDLAQSYARFSLAVQQAGIDVQTIRNLFTGIQAAGRVFGISAEDLSGIFRALEQISSKGKLTSEELIRQLGDRLPGAISITARALNTTSEQLVEDLRQGSISAERFFKAFGQQTILEFYSKAVSLSDTLNARLARLGNLATIAREKLGNIVSNTVIFAAERLARAALKVSDAFAPLGPIVTSFIERFQTAINAINFEFIFTRVAELLSVSISRLDGFASRLARVGIVFNGAAIVSAFGSIQIILEAVNRLMGRFVGFLQQSTGIDLSTTERAFAAVAAAIDQLPNIISRFRNIGVIVLTTFGNVFRAIGNFFSKLTTISGTFFTYFAKAAQNMFGWLIPDDLLAAWTNMINEMQSAASEIATQIGSDIEGVFDDIAAAQRRIKATVELGGADGKDLPAAKGINNAADNLRNALKNDPGDILSIEEAVRKLNTATFGVKQDETQVQQKQAADIATTAQNTSRLVDLISSQQRLTPFVGRAPGVV